MRPAMFEDDFLGQLTVLVPTLIEAVVFSLHQLSHRLRGPVRIPFDAQTVGETPPIGFSDLQLTIGVPTFGEAVQLAIHYGGARPQGSVRIALHQEAIERTRVSRSIKTALAQLQIVAGQFRGLHGQPLKEEKPQKGQSRQADRSEPKTNPSGVVGALCARRHGNRVHNTFKRKKRGGAFEPASGRLTWTRKRRMSLARYSVAGASVEPATLKGTTDQVCRS